MERISSVQKNWKRQSGKGEEVPADFPLKEIYSTLFTNASGIKQTVVVGNTETEVKATIPWFKMDGYSWTPMRALADKFCPAMKNPSIMHYGGRFHIMGGEFKTIYSSPAGLNWTESADKFRYASKRVVIPGEDEDDEDTIEYKSLFEGKGDYSLAIDKNHYIWIAWNDCSVWRGRLNKLGFTQQ